jgi:O-6-methylguanine DNA methyltransferase
MRVTRHAYEVEGWGVGELWEADGRLVVAHEPPTKRRAPATATSTTRPRGTPGVPTETLSRKPSREGYELVPDLLERIHRFFGGARDDFADVPLDLDDCTAFQRAVAEALRRVPWGEVVAYGELAQLAGYPRAGRAVGTFCAHNRYFLLIPCHRVVGADGIGSYGSLGVSYKRRLLRLEGHAAL